MGWLSPTASISTASAGIPALDQFLGHRVGAGLGLVENHFQMPLYRHVGRAAGGMAHHPDGARAAIGLEGCTAAADLAYAGCERLVPSPGK